MNWLNQLKNFPLGIFLGCFFSILIHLIFTSELSDELKLYGTYIITAMITLLGSGIALSGVFWSSENQRIGRLRAAQATLPLALTKLISISKSGVSYSLKGDSYFKDPTRIGEMETALELPVEVITILKECIENSDKEAQVWLSLIISHYQIYKSRLVGTVKDPNRRLTKDAIIQYVSDWCVCHAIVEHLYDYARKGIPPKTELDKSRLNRPVFDFMDNKHYSDIIERNERWANQKQPLTAENLTL